MAERLELDAYPTPAHVSELSLLHGHGPAVYRRERCACGEAVVQLVGETETAAVQRHQKRERHKLWREVYL